MPEEDRKRIKGVLINKFRGDVTLLQSGIDMIEELTHVPVLGVVPYADIDIDSEDSVALGSKGRSFNHEKDLDVAIITLKRISNFTDFHSLEIQPDVSVRYVMPGDAIGNPDLLILPGSKNTIEDMQVLQDSGIVDEIRKCADQGVRIFGICGGFQLLGKKISDPNHVESELDEIEGLGLLDVETQMQGTKRTTQVQAEHEGQLLEGYEIHMGETEISDQVSPFSRIVLQNGEKTSRYDGAVSPDKRIQGTYLHGVFDNSQWTRDYLNQIRMEKGLEPITDQTIDLKEFKDLQYDKLAAVIRDAVDMNKIYQIMNGEDL